MALGLGIFTVTKSVFYEANVPYTFRFLLFIQRNFLIM
jgi:hypothetical protein